MNSKIHSYDLGFLKFSNSWCLLDYLKVLFQQLEGIVMGLTCEIFQLSCTNSKILFFIHHLTFAALKLGLPLKFPFLQNNSRVFVKIVGFCNILATLICCENETKTKRGEKSWEKVKKVKTWSWKLFKANYLISWTQ